VKLSDRARANGIAYKTAWLWWKQGKLPVPARQLPSGTILIDVLTRFCARLYGHRSARRRAEKAMQAVTAS